LKNEKILFIILCAAAFCALLIWAVMPGRVKEAAAQNNGTAPAVMIIDAGHGGADGGAVSKSGAKESEINLSIAIKTEIIANLCGVHSVMTRKDENSLHAQDADTIREQKVSDMKSRVSLVNSYDNALLVSIHQNSYEGKASGAQVFFRKGSEISVETAAAVQENLRLALCESNSRVPAPIPKSAYLFSHTTCPAILVECGFLSDAVESDLLREDGYQTRAALAIIAGYLAALQEQPPS
jgi:N-acetylmuramoyl-L-alanine amidase